jgi:hypothetical protein
MAATKTTRLAIITAIGRAMGLRFYRGWLGSLPSSNLSLSINMRALKADLAATTTTDDNLCDPDADAQVLVTANDGAR